MRFLSGPAISVGCKVYLGLSSLLALACWPISARISCCRSCTDVYTADKVDLGELSSGSGGRGPSEKLEM